MPSGYAFELILSLFQDEAYYNIDALALNFSKGQHICFSFGAKKQVDRSIDTLAINAINPLRCGITVRITSCRAS